MFTAGQREAIRSELLDRAARDPRISGAAITGSAAAGREDQWSDIDLAFGIADEAQLPDALSDWTAHMYEQHEALHHADVKAGAWIYRVFLLASTLQVDLAFVAAAEFRALAPSFSLVFGRANEARHAALPQAGDVIGMAWLYALHARSAIARRRVWQAEYMISGMRDHALALACVGRGLSAAHGRGMDLLPAEVLSRFEGSLVGSLEVEELARAFRVVTEALLSEVRRVDLGLDERLSETLLRLAHETL